MDHRCKLNNLFAMLYVDDLTGLFMFRKPGQMVAAIKKYLLLLQKWLQKWRLKQAVDTCSYTVFSNNSNYSIKIHLDLK